MKDLYRYSVEELAFVLAHSGNLEAGYGYLQTMLGVEALDGEQFKDWMTVASHSLIARGDLSLDNQGNYGELEPDLQRIAQAIARDQRTLRCHRAYQGNQEFIAFLMDDDLNLGHWLEQRVIAVIEVIGDTQGVQGVFDRVAAFVGLMQGDHPLANALDQPDDTNSAYLAIDVLSDLRKTAQQQDAARVHATLIQKMRGGNRSVLDSFAATLAQPNIAWGNVIRPERVNGEMMAERGFLFVAAPDSPWLLPLDANHSDVVQVLPGSRKAINALCQQILLN